MRPQVLSIDQLNQDEPRLDPNEAIRSASKAEYRHDAMVPGCKYPPGTHVNRIMKEYYRERWMAQRLSHPHRSQQA